MSLPCAFTMDPDEIGCENPAIRRVNSGPGDTGEPLLIGGKRRCRQCGMDASRQRRANQKAVAA